MSRPRLLNVRTAIKQCSGPRIRLSVLGDGSSSQIVAARTAGGNLIRRRAGPCGRWVWLVQLDVAPGQEARGNHWSRLTSIRTAGSRELEPELVHSDSRFPNVLRSCSELDSWEQGVVGVGGATDVSYIRAGGWLKVPVNAVAAHMQPGEDPGGVMVNEVHVAEEPSILAASHQAEIRVIAAVGEDESTARGEVTRGGHNVGFCHGCALEQQKRHKESCHQEWRDEFGDGDLFFAHCSLIPSY